MVAYCGPLDWRPQYGWLALRMGVLGVSTVRDRRTRLLWLRQAGPLLGERQDERQQEPLALLFNLDRLQEITRAGCVLRVAQAQ